jgi:hypothetical protein
MTARTTAKAPLRTSEDLKTMLFTVTFLVCQQGGRASAVAVIRSPLSPFPTSHKLMIPATECCIGRVRPAPRTATFRRMRT